MRGFEYEITVEHDRVLPAVVWAAPAAPSPAVIGVGVDRAGDGGRFGRPPRRRQLHLEQEAGVLNLKAEFWSETSQFAPHRHVNTI